MEYISTRGEAPSLGFCDALLAGLALAGGLLGQRLDGSASVAAGIMQQHDLAVAVSYVVDHALGELVAEVSISKATRLFSGLQLLIQHQLQV